MSGKAMEELQQAIYAALSADSALDAIISGIFDRVPEGTALPYVVIGSARAADASNASRQGALVRMELSAFSRTGGRKQTLEILQCIQAVLHLQSLSLDGGLHLVWMRVEQMQAQMLRDGMTWQGTASLSALVEPA